LTVFFEIGEFAQQQAHNTYGLHVLDEESQPAAAGQGVVGYFQPVDALRGGFGHALSPAELKPTADDDCTSDGL
jgi:hypothetical protein